MEEIFVYDLTRIPIGSNVYIRWKNQLENAFELVRYNKGAIQLRELTTEQTIELFKSLKYIDRVWLFK